MIKIDFEKTARALRLFFLANVPCALWDFIGVGKSSVVFQSVPQKPKPWGFYDVRLSDKEASDLGGIPYPVEQKKEKRVQYLMSNLLLFEIPGLPEEQQEKCVLFFDEFDRTPDLSVQNAALQLVLDRRINGHRLSPNARIVIAGNGATDQGTIPLTTASANRMGHLYIDSKSTKAINAWLDWAKGSDCSPELQSFANYKSDVWTSHKPDNELEEYGIPTPRSFCMADKLWRIAQAIEQERLGDPKVGFETSDIILPVMAGCVGQSAAIEMLAWYKVCNEAPSMDQIIADPKGTRLPSELGIFFALGMTIARQTKTRESKEIDALCTYLARWPREQASFAFTHALRENSETAGSPQYLSWKKSNKN